MVNIKETSALLATIQVWDKRTVGETEIVAWSRNMPLDIDLERATRVVNEWYLKTRDMIALSDIIHGVRQTPRPAYRAIERRDDPEIGMPAWFRERYAKSLPGIPVVPADEDLSGF
jgi:hypothetical protein